MNLISWIFWWQAPVAKVGGNPLAFLQNNSGGPNWVVVGGGVVLLIAVLLLLKKLFVSGRKTPKPRTAGFPADEASLQGVYEESATGIMLLARDGKILHSNRAAQEFFGIEAAQLHGQLFVNLAHPEDAHADKSLFTELIEGKRRRYQLERRFYDANGQVLWTRQEVYAPPGASLSAATPGAVALVLLEDMTAARSAQSELRVAREALHDLYQVIVSRDLDLMEKLGALLKMGCRRFNVETGVLAEIVPDGFEVIQVASPDERIRRGKTYERATDLGDWPEPVFARNARLPESESAHLSRDWRQFPFYGIADVEVYISAPVFVSGELFGALAFSGVSQREEEFTSGDKEFMQLMAQWLGAELERLQAQAELEAKQSELMAANAQLEALATVDALTGVKNRRAMKTQLDMEVSRAHRYQMPLSVIMLDVDSFKTFNDSFGHPAGDEVLRQVADVLGKNVRVIDFVARYGGEEFTVVLPQTDAPGAMIVAERLRSKIESAKWHHRPITISLGVATMNEEIRESDQLLSHADRALYASKQGGRNRSTHVGDVDTTPANSS